MSSRRETGKQGIRQRPNRLRLELHWRTFRTMEQRQSSVYMQYIYVWMYICMYVCMYGYTYIRMYTSTHNCMCIYIAHSLIFYFYWFCLGSGHCMLFTLCDWLTDRQARLSFGLYIVFMQRRGQWKLWGRQFSLRLFHFIICEAL